MSLEKYSIKDVTPENSIGRTVRVQAEVVRDGYIMHLSAEGQHVGTMFRPHMEFANKYGDILLHDKNAYIYVQDLVRK